MEGGQMARSNEALIARGEFAEIAESSDKWTDKETGEVQERHFFRARLEYTGGQHMVRAPYDGGEEGLRAAFKDVKAGEEVAVPVRLNPFGRLELVAGAVASKVNAAKVA